MITKTLEKTQVKQLAIKANFRVLSNQDESGLADAKQLHRAGVNQAISSFFSDNKKQNRASKRQESREKCLFSVKIGQTA